MRAAYQGEIDNLTKRSKLAENSFLSVYKVLGMSSINPHDTIKDLRSWMPDRRSRGT